MSKDYFLYLEEYGCPACEFYNADTRKCENPYLDSDCEYKKNFGRTLNEVWESEDNA